MNSKKNNSMPSSGDIDRLMSSDSQISGLVSKLSPEDLARLRQVLSSPEQTRRILATPQAQAMLQALKKNGGSHT